MSIIPKNRFWSFYIILVLVTIVSFSWYLYKPITTFADVAQVSGQNTGEHSETPNSLPNLAYPGSVTSGNTIIVIVMAYRSGVSAPVINTPTKASGTATIGAFTQDANYNNNFSNDRFELTFYRASVTGTGSLTIGFTGTFDAAMGIINEYSGMAASPLDGTAVTNTGSATPESTGSVTSSTCGVVIMASDELSSTNFTYSNPTGTSIYSNSNGSATFTGQAQHKIISTASSNTLNITISTAMSWSAVGVAYKAAACAAATATIPVRLRGIGEPGIGPNIKIRGAANTPSIPYSTTFAATENPISESGSWFNGGTIGLDWTNVRTTTNLAFGTQVGTNGTDDATAVLSSTGWGPNQTIQGTVRVISASSHASVFEEVELRVRTTITPHSITGYEVLCSVNTNASNRYVEIVRWNGPLNDFTSLDSQAADPAHGCLDGDILKIVVNGNTITGYINGVQKVTATDSTYTTGNPGIGFYYATDGSDAGASPSNYGFSSFSATDDTDFANVKFR